MRSFALLPLLSFTLMPSILGASQGPVARLRNVQLPSNDNAAASPESKEEMERELYEMETIEMDQKPCSMSMAVIAEEETDREFIDTNPPSPLLTLPPTEEFIDETTLPPTESLPTSSPPTEFPTPQPPTKSPEVSAQSRYIVLHIECLKYTHIMICSLLLQYLGSLHLLR